MAGFFRIPAPNYLACVARTPSPDVSPFPKCLQDTCVLALPDVFRLQLTWRTMSADASSTSAFRDTSRHLLALARLGDAGALGRLLDRHIPQLRRWARGRLPRWARSAVDTSDLLQDAVVGVIPQLGKFEQRGRHALGAYLRAAVQNRIRDEQRRIMRRGLPEALHDELVDSQPLPDDVVIAVETESCYRKALASLSPDERELIVAHVELHYTHEQLGCMTGRSRQAARMALHRAVRRLGERMQDG